MSVKYVDAALGTDDAAHGGSPGEGAWKTLTYALTGSRVSGGDTIYLSAGVHDSYPSGVTYCDSSVGGTGQVIIDGQDAATLNLVSSSTQSMFQNGGSVSLLFKNVSFTNTSNTDRRMLSAYNSGRIYTENVIINYGTRHFATCAASATLSISGDVISCKSLVYISSTNSPVVTIRDCEISSCENLILNGFAASLNMTVEGNTINGATSSRLFEITAGTVSGSVKYNKILAGGALTSPMYMFGPVLNAVLSGALEITDNVLWWNGFDALAEATKTTILHNLFSFPTDANRCDFVPGKNYFTELDSSFANKVVGGIGGSITKGSGVVCSGDSIVYNYGWESTFESLTGVAPVNAGLGGSKIEGVYFLIDRYIDSVKPKYLLLQCGMNDFIGSSKSEAFVTSAVFAVRKLLEKAIFYGVEVIWCCMTPKSATDTDVQAFNRGTQLVCKELGINYIDISAAYRCNADWASEYYDDLNANIHPNTTGRVAQGRAWASIYNLSEKGVKIEGVWAPFVGSLPTSAQPCKDHALPIGTGKITIFDGVASASQIEEAK